MFESLQGLRLVRGSGDGLAGCKWRLEGSRLGLFVSKSSAMVCQRRTIFQQEHDPRYFLASGPKKMELVALTESNNGFVASGR